ncbi:MAG TPA: hypothetical protein VGF74_04340 [Thermoleophilaceae bacterium]
MDDPTRARFPDVPAEAGHYESFYLRAAHPSEALGIWIRYTVHKRPGSEPRGSLWFTLFDAKADGPWATKLTAPGPRLPANDDFIEISGATFGPDAVAGSAGDASWDLHYTGDAEPLLHLPRDWMYRGGFPRTKTLSPTPAALYSGTVRVGERTIELDRWPGMVGHNWGTEHAERWVWMHGIGFEGKREDTWIDAAVGRVRVGRFTTPWMGNGGIAIDGKRYRLGGIEKTRGIKVTERPTRCDFQIPGQGITVRGTVGSDAKNFVGWVYVDPAGPEHNTVNCSISDMELTVSRNGEPDLVLATHAGASYELGMRETDHGIPLQPFGDG